MFNKDEWLSRYFKSGAYSYSISSDNNSEALEDGFAYTKIPIENQADINRLIKGGFNLVEILVNFEQKTPVKSVDNHEITVGFVRKEEQAEVLEIAQNAFLASRLYQDSHISHATASQIKKDWVANYFLGQRGDHLIVARVGDKVVGFLLLVNQITIDLIAVSPNYHRRGMASAMIGLANDTVGLLKAGTQLNNLASITMYQKNGFFLKQAYCVLHKFFGTI